MSCVCLRVCLHASAPRPRARCSLKAGFTLFGMCVVLPWCFLVALGAPCALQPLSPNFSPHPSYWGFGTSSQKPPPSDCHIALSMSLPLPLPPAWLWPVASVFPRAGHPDLAQKSRAGGLPTPVCVISCTLGKVESSINCWCSGLQLCGFLLGQGWGPSRQRLHLGPGQ